MCAFDSPEPRLAFGVDADEPWSLEPAPAELPEPVVSDAVVPGSAFTESVTFLTSPLLSSAAAAAAGRTRRRAPG